MAQGWVVHTVTRHSPLASLHSLHATYCTIRTRKYMFKLNPGDWFCWEAQFNTSTGFGACSLGS